MPFQANIWSKLASDWAIWLSFQKKVVPEDGSFWSLRGGCSTQIHESIIGGLMMDANDDTGPETDLTKFINKTHLRTYTFT